jgi:hypothetical protein
MITRKVLRVQICSNPTLVRNTSQFRMNIFGRHLHQRLTVVQGVRRGDIDQIKQRVQEKR